MDDGMPNLPVSQTSPLFDNASIRYEYHEMLDSLKSQYPDHTPFIGKTNPYTGTKITSKRAFDEYVRQYALRCAYEQLFGQSSLSKYYATEKARFQAQLAAKDGEITRLRKDLCVKTETAKKAAIHQSRLVTFGLLLIAALLFYILLFSPKEAEPARVVEANVGFSDRYDEGYSEGYDSGKSERNAYEYQKGYSEGYNAGKLEGNGSEYQEGYNEGYNAGKSEGRSSGYQEGYKAGEAAGKQTASGSGGSSIVQSSPPSRSSESSETVYVSRNGKIHKKSNCSGMKYYTEMTYSSAIAAGYSLCSKCY